jgi:NADH-quinone oxidoreductase subunit D
MSMNPTLQSASDLLKPFGVEAASSEDRFDMEVPSANLMKAVTALIGARWGYLTAITGLDFDASAAQAAPAEQKQTAPGNGHTLGVLYHFCHNASVLTLRVKLPRENPKVPSLSGILPVAVLFERELSEVLGVEVEGIPDTSRMFLSDDWPAGVYPLRKDFSPEKMSPMNPTELSTVQPLPAETPGKFIIPIGPQHPALKEPGHFELTVDGEIVTGVSIRLGYVHRGIEKAAESRTWIQNLYLMERVCGICSHIHATAYALGVEKLAGVTVPPRGQAIRTLFCELERIHSHLLWVGVAAHEAGFDTLFMYSWRDRETVMDLLEKISGNRVNYAVNVLGGVKFDIDQALADEVRKGIDYLERRSNHYLKIVTSDESFLRRTRGVGTIASAEAETLGLLGPTARASGVSRDLRIVAPYASYGDFKVNVALDSRGDLEARYVVRIKELFEAYRLIREILDKLPAGEISAPVPRRIPEGEAIIRVEAPRGELFYFIRSTGGIKPDRVKVRTPSLSNWAAVSSVAVGHRLADIPMILVGIDPCFSCNDRAVTIRRPGGMESWSWEELRRHGIRSNGGKAV